MFNKTTAPAVEVGHDVIVTAEPPVPLSVLSLDLAPPPIGWVAYLNNIGVEIVEDSIGRSAVSSADARLLISEHRRAEEVKAEMRARQEREAIEADRQFRARLGRGIPASVIPAGSTYVAAVQSAELDAVGYRPRRTSVAEVLLSNSPGEVVFHSLAEHDADDGW
jgi:hypothetical protein